MIDLAELNVDWLAVYVRQTRNFAPLVKWLRSSAESSEALRLLLADILEGNVKPSGKRKSKTDGHMAGVLKLEIKFWKNEFLLHAQNPTALDRGGKVAFDWHDLKLVLRSAAYSGALDTNGECGEAARTVVCWLNNLTPYELDKVLRRKPSIFVKR